MTAAALTTLAAFPGKTHAIGVRIPNQDAEAIAKGNAFAATADNPSAIYYNPAGITQLPGQNVQVGVLNYLGINTHYESPSGVEEDSKFKVIPVPQIYYTTTLESKPLSFGIGVYAPYGLGVQWPEDSALRQLAINSKLQYITVNPVVAWRILPNLSVAIGPQLNYSELSLSRGLATATDKLSFKGDDIAFGFNAGLLWHVNTNWSVGANYRSASTAEYSGRTKYFTGAATVSTDTDAEIPFPQVVSGGISFRPTPNWNLEVNVDWTDWNQIDTVTLEGTGAIFGSDLPLQLNWHGTWMYEVGATRYFADGWFAAAGYYYVTDTASNRNFTPGIPDTELHVGSIGLGRRGERWNWAVAGQLIAGPERNVTGNQPSPVSADGGYQLFIPTVSFSVGYRF